MVTQGSMNVGCGTYSYKIEVPLEVSCKPGETPAIGWHYDPNGPSTGSKPVVSPRSVFLAAAHRYCDGSRYNWVSTAKYDNIHSQSTYAVEYPASGGFLFDSTTIDPATNLPGFCFGPDGLSDQFGPDGHLLYCKAHGFAGSDSGVTLQVSPSQDQTGCSSLKDHKLPTGDECIKNFENVVNQCKCLLEVSISKKTRLSELRHS